MTWLNSGIRAFLLAQGTAARWLRDELDALKVRIPLTDGCVEELARAADQAARHAGAAGDTASYVELLRAHLIVQADWVRRWTTTDEKAPADDPIAQAFVRIARKYALPRPWKLSDPVAVAVTRPVPAWVWGGDRLAPTSRQSLSRAPGRHEGEGSTMHLARGVAGAI